MFDLTQLALQDPRLAEILSAGTSRLEEAGNAAVYLRSTGLDVGLRNYPMTASLGYLDVGQVINARAALAARVATTPTQADPDGFDFPVVPVAFAACIAWWLS